MSRVTNALLEEILLELPPTLGNSVLKKSVTTKSRPNYRTRYSISCPQDKRAVLQNPKSTSFSVVHPRSRSRPYSIPGTLEYNTPPPQ